MLCSKANPSNLSNLRIFQISQIFFVLLHPHLRRILPIANAPVVQLNRMSDSGSEDRGFESRRGYDSHPFWMGFFLAVAIAPALPYPSVPAPPAPPFPR